MVFKLCDRFANACGNVRGAIRGPLSQIFEYAFTVGERRGRIAYPHPSWRLSASAISSSDTNSPRSASANPFPTAPRSSSDIVYTPVRRASISRAYSASSSWSSRGQVSACSIISLSNLFIRSSYHDRSWMTTERISVVPCHRRQLGHVLQQYPSALQVQDAVLAPELQLTVDAFAGGADEDAELLLRDVHFGPEVGGECTEPSRQADRQRLQHRFLHPLALPADALAQQHHDLDGDLGLAFQEGQEILAPQHEQFRRLAGGGVRGAALAVEDGDLAEQIAGAHEIQRQAAAVGSAGFDPDLAAPDAIKSIAGIALLEQHFAETELLGVAKAGDALQFVRTQIRKHRIHFQDDRKFGLFAHCT